MEEKKVKCSQCEELIDFDESYEWDNEIYCEYCWNENSEICFFCGENYHYEEFSNIMFVPWGYCGSSEWKTVWYWKNNHPQRTTEYKLQPGYYALPNSYKANCREDVVMSGQYTLKKAVFLRPLFGDCYEDAGNTDFWEPTENLYMICEGCKEKRFNKNSRWQIKRKAKEYRASFNTGFYYYLLCKGKYDLIPSLGKAVHSIAVTRAGMEYAKNLLYRRNERRSSLIFSCYHCKEEHQHKYTDKGFECTNCGKANYSYSGHLENFAAKKETVN